MSDLEDDVLMAYLAQHRELEKLKKEIVQMRHKAELQEKVWIAFDHLLTKLKVHPEVFQDARGEVEKMEAAINAALSFEEHSGGE